MVSEHRTFCRICSAACALVVTTDGRRVVGARGDNDDPVSRGYSCPKGRSVGALHHHPKRIDGALMRDAVRRAGARRLGRLPRRSRAHACAACAPSTATTPSPSTWRRRRRSTRSDRATPRASRSGLATRNRYSAVTLDSPCKPLVAELMAGRSDLLPAVDLERATLVDLHRRQPGGEPRPLQRLPRSGDAAARPRRRRSRGVGDRPAPHRDGAPRDPLPAADARAPTGCCSPTSSASCSTTAPMRRSSTSTPPVSIGCAPRSRRSIGRWRSSAPACPVSRSTTSSTRCAGTSASPRRPAPASRWASPPT